MTRAALVLVGCALVLSCGSKELAHVGEAAPFPLRGKHTAVACETCHTAGFNTLPTSCVACHEVDRPAPDHYPGEACDGCHIEDGWEFATPPEPPPPPPFDHSTLPDTTLCWECHEKERPDPTHYAAPELPVAQWADCGPCHGVEVWKSDYVHPVRVPHGSTTGSTCDPVEDATAWSTGCNGCHPDTTDRSIYVCYACHEGVHPDANYLELVCTGCHVGAEPTNCDSLL